MAAGDSALTNNERSGKKNEAARSPVVWTPEDAANFLGAAIKEAQRPLAEALRRQGVPAWLFLLLILIGLGLGTAAARSGQQYLRRLFREQEALQQEIVRLRAELAAAGRERGESEAARARLEARLEIMAEQFGGLRDAKLAAEEEAAALRQELQDAKAAPRQEVENLRVSQAAAAGREAALRAESERLQLQVEMQRQEIERLRRDLRLLAAQIENGEAEREALRKQARLWREWLSAEKAAGAHAPPAVEPLPSITPPAEVKEEAEKDGGDR